VMGDSGWQWATKGIVSPYKR